MEKNYQNEKFLEAYISSPEKQYWYNHTFSKYDVQGVEKFSWGWSWWACFFGPLYLLYRKCYKEALVVWLITLVITGLSVQTGILTLIAQGTIFPFLVFRRYKKTVSEVEKVESDTDKQLELLRKLGGVDQISLDVGIGVSVVLVIFLIVVFQ